MQPLSSAQVNLTVYNAFENVLIQYAIFETERKLKLKYCWLSLFHAVLYRYKLRP